MQITYSLAFAQMRGGGEYFKRIFTSPGERGFSCGTSAQEKCCDNIVLASATPGANWIVPAMATRVDGGIVVQIHST